MFGGEAPPNQTVYASNLPDKLKKEETRQLLYALFSQFGKVVDVVALKTDRLRGQAWVVFADLAAATAALRALQGFPFFDKPMRLQFANSQSRALSQGRVGRSGGDGQTTAGPPVEQLMRQLGATPVLLDVGQPHHSLFCEGLPEATTGDMLAMLFQQFAGFQEARLIPSKPGIAFVHFENERQAGVALAGLQGFKITPQNVIQLTFAKQ